MKQLGIYIHIPFCKKKCHYCDFISYPNQKEWVKEYMSCLIKEIKQARERKILDITNRLDEPILVTSIYIGGGTPSYVEAKYIEQILKTITKYFQVEEKAEITIEVNPGTVNQKTLEKYKQVGVNRLSIGLQSTNQKTLDILGRIHSYQEFEQAYQFAKKVGFRNINVDLMIGVPNQSMEEIEENIKTLILLEPTHISIYSLIVEEHTKLQKQIENKELILPTEELERKMYWMSKQILEEAGYQHYEISNFAKPGYESKHNSDCWSQKEYIGFGVAAHSYTNGIRYSNVEEIGRYMQNIEQGKLERNFILHEKQTHESKMQEYMMLHLRKIEGVTIEEFIQRFHENPINIFKKELDKLAKQGLIVVEENIKLTKQGIDFANLVWEEFV